MRGKAGNRTYDRAKMGRIGERPYPVYLLSMLIRAAHQVGVAVFLAVYLLDILPGPPRTYLILAVVSGGLLFVIELMRHRQNYRELSGIVTIGKCLLLGAAFHGFLPPQGTVLLAFLIASVVAHAPKKVRHRLLY